MNAPASAPMRRSLRSRPILWICSGILGLMMLPLVYAIDPLLGEAIIRLPFGWLGFVERTIPRVKWNWDLIGMGLLCLALVAMAAHWFFSLVTRTALQVRAESADWRWPWKWTWCGIALVGVCFWVGTAFVGIVQVARWVALNPEKPFEVRTGSSYINDLRQVDGAIQLALLEHNTDAESIRRFLFLGAPGERRSLVNEQIRDDLHIMLVIEPGKGVTGGIYFLRDPVRRKAGLCLYWSGSAGDGDFEDAKRISEFLERHRPHLVSL